MSAVRQAPPVWRRRKFWRWTVLILTAIVVLPVFILFGWSTFASAEPEPAALSELVSDDEVTVSVDPTGVTFWPADSTAQPNTAVIFYPGGLVPPEAYAAHLRPLAEAGIPVIIPEMPLNFAIFSPNIASSIVERTPTVHTWVIGGHSLGGAMAAQFAYQNSDVVDGLILWAAYPAENSDLSGSSLAVLSVYGTRDGLIEQAVIEQSKSLLPAEARFFPVPGGNHAQFGRYGEQNGDLPAQISPDEQAKMVTEVTLAFVKAIEGDGR